MVKKKADLVRLLIVGDDPLGPDDGSAEVRVHGQSDHLS